MTDLCSEDIVVRFTEASDITEEETVGGGDEIGSVRLGRVTSSDALELGRRLLAAARDGDTEAVLEHMAKGAPFTTDWLGTSPLHLAAANNRAAVCAVLLRAGVSRDCRTKVERTPLHLAAYWGHADTADLLLRHGADPAARDMLGMTPLHWAVERGHLSCTRALLAAGADPTALSRFHTTPLSLARAAAPSPCPSPSRSAYPPEGVYSEMTSLLEEAMQAREAGRSVSSLKDDEAQPEEPDLSQFVTVEDSTEVNQTDDDSPQSENNTQPAAQSADAESSARRRAARLLRAHGITLLPADEGTALSALRSGRTLLLSDAGKLMLKESSEKSPPGPAAPPGPALPPGPPAPTSPVLLTASPVAAAPPQGVKIFTLNSAPPPTRDANITIKKIIHSGNTVKYVALPSDMKIVSPKKVQVGKPKSPGHGAVGRLTKPASGVKILLNKANLHKLSQSHLNKPNLVEMDNVVEQSSVSDSPSSVVVVPGAYLTSRDVQYLRARLLASHAALARTREELARTREELARATDTIQHYERGQL